MLSTDLVIALQVTDFILMQPPKSLAFRYTLYVKHIMVSHFD